MLPAILAAAAFGISSYDYPKAAAKQGREGLVAAEYIVDPWGRATQCRVTLTSGWPDLDTETCAGILYRTRFRPAVDGNGHPISDVRQLRFRWQLPSGATVAHFPTLPVTGEISVSAFPQGMARATANATFEVAADGKIVGCTVKGVDGTGIAALDKAACDTIRASGFPVVLDRSGKPMAYARVMTITFVTAPSSAR